MLPVTSIALRSPSSAAVVSRRARRLARTASTENRFPSGRNAVHSASSPSIQSPPFSSSVTRLCRLITQITRQDLHQPRAPADEQHAGR